MGSPENLTMLTSDGKSSKQRNLLFSKGGFCGLDT